MIAETFAPARTIPKKLHMIWVGDEAKRPDSCIETWRQKHPAWDFTLWGNAELDGLNWKSRRQIERFRSSGHWEGVADLMRYEILCRHGGFYADADSVCVRPLDERLLSTPMLVVWESERHRPGLVANTFIGSVPRHPALHSIIRATSRMDKPVWRRTWRIERWDGLRPRFRYKGFLPWQTVGPQFFTRKIMPFCPRDVTILPSILFLPKHHLDTEERQSPSTFARHQWGTTHNRAGDTTCETQSAATPTL